MVLPILPDKFFCLKRESEYLLEFEQFFLMLKMILRAFFLKLYCIISTFN